MPHTQLASRCSAVVFKHYRKELSSVFTEKFLLQGVQVNQIADFSKCGLTAIKNLLSLEYLSGVKDIIKDGFKNFEGYIIFEEKFPRSIGRYCPPVAEALLIDILELCKEYLGVSLGPTHSFVRQDGQGDELGLPYR